MPIDATSASLAARRASNRVMRLVRALLVTILPALVYGQEATGRAPGAILVGVVRDSIAGAPLSGAIVQLVSADSLPRFGRTATADSMGQFTLGEVPKGRYVLGFFHPMLDSLGIEPTLREVVVDGHVEMRVVLSTPSPERLRAAICPASTTPASAVLVGVVRDARGGVPAAGAQVTGEWLEMSFSTAGATRRIAHITARTSESGFFALCNVPAAGMMTVAASKDADSTDTIEVPIPSSGVARRDLYLGAAQTVVTIDSGTRADTLPPITRKMRVGSERLEGIVVTAAGQPLANAHVDIVGGPRASVNERGEWRIANAPNGTRMLEVRAVGYYPDRRAVDVIDGAPPVHVVLATLKSVLDTVRVTTSRLRNGRNMGFEERSRSGPGKYLTPLDIARRAPRSTSDLFRNIPGVRVARDADGFETVMIRAVIEDWCQPTLYVNSMIIQHWHAEDVDDWARPEDIVGMEIYAGLTAPPQFQTALSGCGSIVIWTR